MRLVARRAQGRLERARWTSGLWCRTDGLATMSADLSSPSLLSFSPARRSSSATA